MINKIKSWLINNINSKYLELLTGKGISITKIPATGSVVSDLFPLRIENQWNTFFELLNYDWILNPEKDNIKSSSVELKFFNKNGEFLKSFSIKNSKRLKNTLNLKKIANQLGIKIDGSFAVFHEHNNLWISEKGSFIAERGYIGFENKKLGKIKSFIHGNLDAISQQNNKKILLGNSSFLNKEYYLQHELSYKFSYELFWVNSSNRLQHFEIIELRGTEKKSTIFKIKPGGIKSLIIDQNQRQEKTQVIIRSKLYMARPVIFKYMDSSFDVFHG